MIRDTRRGASTIYQLIADRHPEPLKHSDLTQATQTWSPEYRNDCIGWLLMLESICVGKVKPKRGPPAKYYSLAEGSQPPSTEPIDESPREALARELNEARAQIASGYSRLEAAIMRLDEMQATAVAA